MQRITKDIELNKIIKDLELKQKVELNDLKSHYRFTMESLKPKNILKENVYNLTNSLDQKIKDPDFKSTIFKYALGIAGGYLTKKIFIGNSGGFIKKFLGRSLQTFISGLIISKK